MMSRKIPLRCITQSVFALRTASKPARVSQLLELPTASSSRSISSSSTSLFRSSIRRLDSSSISPLNEAAQGEKAIYDKLKAKFGGKQLEVQDVSGGCGSFYAIHISSPLFRDLSTIKQHRLVNECLKEEVKGIHGLQLKTVAEPEE